MDIWKTSDFRTKNTDVVWTQMGLSIGMVFDEAPWALLAFPQAPNRLCLWLKLTA